MPIDAQKLSQNKERILSIIRINGPSLPVKIAKAIGTPPLFAAAFLSELYKEQKLKMSNLRVGSSPLYYIPGQEDLLESFSNHLNQREKEALNLLKESKILDDESQTPVIRVALRSIKDFAIPIKVRINEQTKTFWKYFLVENAELRSLIQKTLSSPAPVPQKPIQKPQPQIQPQPQTIQSPSPKPSPVPQESPSPKPAPILQKPQPQIQTQLSKPSPSTPKPQTKTPKPKIQKQHLFPQNIKSYLEAKDIEILQSIEEKKKEFTAKVRIDTLFGKQVFLLLAKEKKKVTESDLTIALQKAQTEKMPALIISPGDLDKKAQIYIKDWQNLVKFEKIKL
ncbi:hypothetical protein CMI45_00190 [Candidatus Pacearchaeota archaeon]|nr:hypothetical protein [Candidatus Pacearchaeota archaeon]|tara:strand:+ start:157 stop:1170 length:1014 start_codon:yes stop_codon:yes gene_type:complete